MRQSYVCERLSAFIHYRLNLVMNGAMRCGGACRVESIAGGRGGRGDGAHDDVDDVIAAGAAVDGTAGGEIDASVGGAAELPSASKTLMRDGGARHDALGEGWGGEGGVGRFRCDGSGAGDGAVAAAVPAGAAVVSSSCVDARETAGPLKAGASAGASNGGGGFSLAAASSCGTAAPPAAPALPLPG